MCLHNSAECTGVTGEGALDLFDVVGRITNLLGCV
jgi:hypothetical protein